MFSPITSEPLIVSQRFLGSKNVMMRSLTTLSFIGIPLLFQKIQQSEVVPLMSTCGYLKVQEDGPLDLSLFRQRQSFNPRIVFFMDRFGYCKRDHGQFGRRMKEKDFPIEIEIFAATLTSTLPRGAQRTTARLLTDRDPSPKRRLSMG